MKVYIDYIFLENCIFNLIIIYQTRCLSNIEVKKKNAVISSIIGAIYVCVMCIFQLELFEYFWLKFILSFVMVYIAFFPKTLKQYVKLTVSFYLSTILLAGASIVVNQMLTKQSENVYIAKFVVYAISLALSYVYTKHFWRYYTNKINTTSLIKEVKMYLKNRCYEYNGFLDTGNTVYSYELNAPVIFAEVLNNNQRSEINSLECIKVRVATISKESMERVYLTRILIEGKIHKVGVVFVDRQLDKNKKYNMILNLSLYNNECGGISI